VIADVEANNEFSEPTYYSYVQALEKLFIIADVEAWSPAIRSKTAIRTKKKKNLVDPSVAVAALGIGPEYFNTDFQTLGFLFESLCIRDLRIYSAKYGGTVSYYRDNCGLEADAVLHLEDGRYALCEIKLGQKDIEKGATSLIKLESLILAHNEENPANPLRLPDLKIVITGTEYGYRRDDGVLVIPIGCLKD
jgi:predicted AAA+ superfamily ATPase